MPRENVWTVHELQQSRHLRTAKEWREQAELMRWSALISNREPRLNLLYHCPSGELRNPRTATKLKAMGVKPHIPDLFLPVPARHYYEDGARWEQWHGCYIELKRLLGGDDGRAQRALHELLRAQGYNVVIKLGWVTAAEHLCWYLHRPDLAKELRA
jgi:hypothetical protein